AGFFQAFAQVGSSGVAKLVPIHVPLHAIEKRLGTDMVAQGVDYSGTLVVHRAAVYRVGGRPAHRGTSPVSVYLKHSRLQGTTVVFQGGFVAIYAFVKNGFGIAGKAFVQPHFGRTGTGYQVAKPAVGQFVRPQTFVFGG